MNLSIIKLAFVIIIAAIYGGAFCFVYYKYRDCKVDPGKYNEIPNFEEYRYSIWYYNPKKFYGKGSLVEHGLPFTFLFCLGYVFYISAMICVYHYLAPINHSVHFVYGIAAWSVVLICVAFISVCFISDVYLMLSKRPKNICYVQSQLCAHSRRSDVFKERCIFAMIAILALMITRYCTNSEFGYIEDNTLVRMPMFSFFEQVYDLDELADFRISYDIEGEVDECVLVNDKGQHFDIARAGYRCFYDHEEVSLCEYIAPIIIQQNCENSK